MSTVHRSQGGITPAGVLMALVLGALLLLPTLVKADSAYSGSPPSQTPAPSG